VVAAEKKDERNLRIRFKGDLESQAQILSELVSMNIGVVSFKPAASELEDAYLKLVKETV
jgi:hypothetical protein